MSYLQPENSPFPASVVLLRPLPASLLTTRPNLDSGHGAVTVRAEASHRNFTQSKRNSDSPGNALSYTANRKSRVRITRNPCATLSSVVRRTLRGLYLPGALFHSVLFEARGQARIHRRRPTTLCPPVVRVRGGGGCRRTNTCARAYYRKTFRRQRCTSANASSSLRSERREPQQSAVASPFGPGCLGSTCSCGCCRSCRSTRRIDRFRQA